MKVKETKKRIEKPSDPMRMKAKDFDAIMRDALGVPPEPKEQLKVKAKKKAK